MKHLLYFLKRIHRFSGSILYINLVCMMLIGVLESVGIFLLVPLIGITGIMKFSTGNIPFVHWFNSLFSGMSITVTLILILGIYVLLMIGQSVFKRSQSILGVKIQQGFVRHLRDDTYRSLMGADWQFYLRKRKSDLINIMISEILKVNAAIQLFLNFMSSIILMLIQVGVALYLSVKMTVFILSFGIILILFSRTFRKKSKILGMKTFQLNQSYLAGITDQFNGMKDIKSNSLVESHMNWFMDISEEMEDNQVQMTKLNSTSQMIFKIVSAFLIAVFVFFSIRMFKEEPAQVMMIMAIFSRLWPSLQSIQSNLENMGVTIPSLSALVTLQQECLEAKEMENTDNHLVQPIDLTYGIDCRNVTFSYQQSDGALALNHINLHIPANKMTAVVGSSGAGKSTLIDLLMGLNQPDSGEVVIDGVTLTSDRLLALRKSISYIPQDPFLFNSTVRDNLLMIDPDASEEHLWEALEFAAAAEFVKNLPQGLDTLIGDRGIRLSGGERQRLVLARAILRKPSILILDEATSALDSENEAKIQQAIDRLKGKMTIIAIAHRLTTIRNADQVLIMDKGKIIQQGDRSLVKQRIAMEVG
ncbi:ABC transporter ATP-binding protein [Bacillus sp. BRMEA1]|uniref:ABC transporter ATP-binding protein n=1 Tax=Neobacillus endophyticus TaxID=2738405 RepID=UPI0015645780|nr:ABC transporter ATP-binding protein [Neobacillus endophyticus]NRD76971.1 ABC transporter ATP-binding protein [Neobacillus endophyticus]